MTEVEVRAKIKDIKKIEKNLESLGAMFISSELQMDRVYGRDQDLDSNHMIIEGHYSARIRQKDADIKLEFKEIRRKGGGKEISMPIGKIEDGEHFLRAMGFKEAFTVEKTRRLYELGAFEIALDDIDLLGLYIEIEHKIKDGDEDDKLMDECKKMLKKIDEKAKIESRKYGDLMQERLNKA